MSLLRRTAPASPVVPGTDARPNRPWIVAVVTVGTFLVAACSADDGGAEGQSPAPPETSVSTTLDASLSAEPSPVPPFPTGGPVPPGRMVFTRAGSSYADDTPFVSRLDGSHERQLAGTDTCCIRLSPDGRAILGSTVTKDGRITTGIYPLAGTDPRVLPLPPGTLNLGPGAWTSDGEQIVVQGWDDTHPAAAGMYVVDSSDGSHRTRLTREPRHTNDVPGDVSPDGTLLAFVREDAPGDESTSVGALEVLDLAAPGKIHTLLPSSSQVGLTVRFSPDGSLILFQDGRTSQRGALWTIRPDGSHLTKLFDDPDLFASHPTWSPDGRQILFALNPVADYYDHPPNAFYVMDADGTGVRQVFDDGQFKREAEWFLP
ncbi:hypothetical protein [Nocardioides sp.]|uniref:TolB family protein n=1 Tax=Nocardioides sp. TaxID=35761 RepID=UPI0031FED628